MLKEIIIPDNYKYISAFLTMRCNLGCSYCLNNLKQSKEFNRSKFRELTGKQWVQALNRIKSRDEVPVTFSGGEPFLHKDFIYIINNLKPELKIDILTNLQWGSFLDTFVREVNPERLRREAKYSPIRVSYHPQEMDAFELVKNAKKLQDAGFSIGIWGILYPGSEHLSALNQMQFICRDYGIDFRLKEYTGIFKDELYGNYSKYKNSVLQQETKKSLCKTSELLIGPNGNTYRCHSDLFAEENPIGNLLDENLEIKDEFKACDKYGQCHPCDVKVKTNYKQELGHTSVEIKDIAEK